MMNLKPCPFCRALPEYRVDKKDEMYVAEIECECCGAIVRSRNYDGEIAFGDMNDAINSAAKWWNMRYGVCEDRLLELEKKYSEALTDIEILRMENEKNNHNDQFKSRLELN